MKLPKTLKIGGHEVKVLFPYVFKERSDINGQCDYGMSEIRIAELDGAGNKRSDSAIWTTFWHEVLHFIDFNTGHRMFCGDLGENWIEGISEGLYQVLHDNKLIF